MEELVDAGCFFDKLLTNLLMRESVLWSKNINTLTLSPEKRRKNFVNLVNYYLVFSTLLQFLLWIMLAKFAELSGNSSSFWVNRQSSGSKYLKYQHLEIRQNKLLYFVKYSLDTSYQNIEYNLAAMERDIHFLRLMSSFFSWLLYLAGNTYIAMGFVYFLICQ